MDLPSIFLMLFALLNIIAIGWLISARLLIIQKYFLLMLAGAIVFTLTMISFWELYEYLLVENKGLRVAIVWILRIITLSGCIVNLVGAAFFAYYGLYRDIINFGFRYYPISFYLGYLYVVLLFLIYGVISIFAVIFMGSYRFRSPQYYRLNEFAKAIVNEDIMSDYLENITEWALYIPNDDAVMFFKKVIKHLPHAKNDIIIIAKPFALIFPEKIGEFNNYVSLVKRKRALALQLTKEIKEQIAKPVSDSEALELMKELETKREYISKIKPLVEKKKSVPLEAVIEQTNLSKEQVEEVSKYVDREVYEDNLLSNIQYLKKLQKVL
jgi:hypothetical protein